MTPALYWELRARHADVTIAQLRLTAARQALTAVAARVTTDTGLDITQGTCDLDDETRSIVPRWTPETAAGSGSAS